VFRNWKIISYFHKQIYFIGLVSGRKGRSRCQLKIALNFLGQKNPFNKVSFNDFFFILVFFSTLRKCAYQPIERGLLVNDITHLEGNY
jgi:hypothetical protein